MKAASTHRNLTVSALAWLVIFIFFIFSSEVASWFAFGRIISVEIQRQIKAMRGGRIEQAYLIPNAIWHHELNPRFAEYYKLTRWGTRGEDFEFVKPAGELRIITIGDSTTEGWKNHDNETYPFFLQERLRQKQSEIKNFTSVKVINAGIGSHNTAFNLALFSQKLIHFKPDLVVFKSSYNDRQAFFSRNLQHDYTNVFKKPFSSEIRNQGFWRWALRSNTLTFFGALFLDAPFQEAIGVEMDPVLTEDEFEANLKNISLFEANVRSLILLALGNGINPILLDFPNSPDAQDYVDGGFRSELDKTAFKKFGALISKIVSKLAAEYKIPFLATTTFLDGDDFWDHCHNTARGNKKIGEAIADVVLSSLSVPQAPPH